MTGYGQAETTGEKFQLSVEIKSVNHRFRDVRFKMSSLFLSEEMPARKTIENNFTRGSFDVYVNYKLIATDDHNINIDEKKVKAYLTEAGRISREAESELKVDAGLFLKNEFSKTDEVKEVELKELFPKTFEQAISSLLEKRLAEGKDVLKTFQEYIGSYKSHLKTVVTAKDGFKPHLEDKLKKRIQESSLEIENIEPRLMQEVIFYLEKWDVDEELTRIDSHVHALSDLLQNPPNNTAGRKIEFILQELGRETNTIGSKSHNKDVSEAIVEMKVLLEKMREQAANVQ